MMESLRFSIPEILSLIGVVQCVYLLVYITFRAGRISRAGLPLLYFLVLGLGFFLDLGRNYLGVEIESWGTLQWLAWSYGPPLSVLMLIQIAQITRVPALKHYWVLLLLPVAYLASRLMAHDPEHFSQWLVITGFIAGAVSLLAMWGQSRRLLESLHTEKAGKERYWLIIAVIIMNIFLLVTMLASLSPVVLAEAVVVTRTLVGLGFVYLVTTSLFRIYPRAVNLLAGPARVAALSPEDKALAEKIEKLLTLDKVYQESTYSRADLAQECGTSEAVISRVINTHFQKSFPQLMNEYRVTAAKGLLKQTDMPVRVIFGDVGFNSLPSFNRVFKDTTGQSPSEFRKSHKK